MPKRKMVLVATVNDEAIRKIETVPCAPATAMAEKPSSGRAVSAVATEGRAPVIHQIKTIGRARVLEFQIDPQSGHIVKTPVANGDDGGGDDEADEAAFRPDERVARAGRSPICRFERKLRC